MSATIQLPCPPYDLLAVDLDGTLLNSEGEVSPANRDAIFRARAAGMTVIVCTGRDFSFGVSGQSVDLKFRHGLLIQWQLRLRRLRGPKGIDPRQWFLWESHVSQYTYHQVSLARRAPIR